MARLGWGSRYGYQADSTRRDSTGGKNALITEIVDVAPSSDAVIIYSHNMAMYYGGHTTTLQYFTTGAAILQNIKHVLSVNAIHVLSTAAFTTTTAIRTITCRIRNGATTLVHLYTPCPVHAGMTIRVTVLGKAF